MFKKLLITYGFYFAYSETTFRYNYYMVCYGGVECSSPSSSL
jgi:hypothetical protein